jgi:hypothetical protein
MKQCWTQYIGKKSKNPPKKLNMVKSLWERTAQKARSFKLSDRFERCANSLFWQFAHRSTISFIHSWTQQSWAHRSFELSDRSKAMSDPWISERKEKSVERRANCQKKEFADRSKRSLNLKERSAKPHFEQFALERCKVKRVDNPLLETGYMTHLFCRYEILYVFLFRMLYKSVDNFAKLYFWKLWLVKGMFRYGRLTVTIRLIFWT